MKLIFKRLINKIQYFDYMQKSIILTCTILIACLYLITIYFNIIIELCFTNKSVISKINKSTKLILYWNKLFDRDDFYIGHGDICKFCNDIPNDLTYASSNRKIKNIDDYDMILFHGSELDIYDLPNKRNNKQKYIYVNLESPINRPIENQIFENFFNLTMTYRLDSDIPFTYSEIYDKKIGNIIAPLSNTSWKTFDYATDMDIHDDDNDDLLKLIKKKKKNAIWFVSNCHSAGGREKYVEELSKHMNVDIFGKCGNEIKCPREENCFKKIVEPEYYFYLSFENSLCQDYVTEKLFTALKYNVVPVVYGGANYSKFAPPNSYVNSLDFDSPKNLAEYLIKLSNDPNEYVKYFKWKKYYKLADDNNAARCKLCEILHNDKRQYKFYDPLSTWYSKCPLQKKIDSLNPYLTKSTNN